MKVIDIETIPNESIIEILPEPEVALGNTKDPEKISAKIEEAKKKQIDKMQLDPTMSRMCCFSIFGDNETDRFYRVVPDDSEASEIAIVSELLEHLMIGGNEPNLIVTQNGMEFDLPYIYKRALLLKIDLPESGNMFVPPLSYWIKKYTCEPHLDIKQVWCNWGHNNNCPSNLDWLGKCIEGQGKTDRDYSTYLDLIKNGEGDKIGLDCICDAELTYKIALKIKKYFY